jgi:hypothetical protein
VKRLYLFCNTNFIQLGFDLMTPCAGVQDVSPSDKCSITVGLRIYTVCIRHYEHQIMGRNIAQVVGRQLPTLAAQFRPKGRFSSSIPVSPDNSHYTN